MEVTVCKIPLTLQKKNNQWSTCVRGTSKLYWMQWNGEDWFFISQDTPEELKAIEEKKSIYT